MTKEEFLKSINITEEVLKAQGKEVVRFDDGDPECPGWEVRYVDKENIEVILGCKCSDTGSIHTKL
ncbi:hypothetical protein [uncultured Ilyobacter sp.]|uniref:hypothetical protein n=1 Tax=uncultured Ilyobacter sp. TaxID=544433 RepID=UPI0029C750F7|nr:hypothetical protein [uncultured Ilyobacter sp.]